MTSYRLVYKAILNEIASRRQMEDFYLMVGSEALSVK